MLRLVFGIIVLFFASPAWAQEGSFTGRVALTKAISSFDDETPVAGTLYLLTGSAAAIRILSEEPFEGEVDFVEASWLSDAELVARQVVLSFVAPGWASVLKTKKPRTGGEALIYPYRKFQVAALFDGYVFAGEQKLPRFRVLAVPLFF